MSNKEQTPSEALREKFRAELLKPLSERYFSEDDLINVFDSAGDDFNDYIRTEALLLGARLYPDSMPLLERKAIFYLDTDQQLFTEFMEDNEDVATTMFDILRLNLLLGFPVREIESRVDNLISNLKFEEDEEVIQFVQTLHTLGLDGWLVKHLDLMKQKVQYLPTLLYEYAYQAEDSTVLSDVAVKVLEELTELEPYVADYWTMLAIAYIRDERIDDATSAIEYALAIEPDNFHALKTKLYISNIGNKTDECMATALSIMKVNPNDAETAAMISMYEEDKDRLHQFISGLSPVARTSRALAIRAIGTEYPLLDSLLSDLYDNGITNPEDWRSFADFAYDSANFSAINEIMRIYEQKAGKPLGHDFLLMRLMFDLGNYPLVAKIYSDSEDGSTIRSTENLYVGYSIFLVALLRMGDLKTAENAASSLLEMLENDKNMVGSSLEQQAMRDYLKEILKKLNAKRPTDWSKFPPLP